MMEIVKRLGRDVETLKKTRAKRDVSMKANEELGLEIVRKEAELKKGRTELTKAQGYAIEYLMKEE